MLLISHMVYINQMQENESVNEEWKHQDWDVFGPLQVAAHPGRNQSLPPLQQTAIQRRHILRQLRWRAAGVARLRSKGSVGGGGLLPLPVPERCHKISVRHQPGLYLADEIVISWPLTLSPVFFLSSCCNVNWHYRAPLIFLDTDLSLSVFFH